MGTTKEKTAKGYEEEAELFNIINSIGEGIEGKMHIIDSSDAVDFYDLGERKYKVYHADGYCLDIEKLVNSYTDETENEVKDYYYVFYDEWEGFKTLEIQEYIDLIKPYLK